jgi:muramidase (phage lysozyme)
MSRPVLIVGVAGLAAVWLLWQASQQAAGDDDPGYQPASVLDEVQGTIDEAMSMQPDQTTQQTNVAAFLSMIRVSEGTAGPDGYRTLVGGALFDSYADHPRTLVPLPNLGIKSSAAGAYQILMRTWDGVRGKLGLPDFSPASQDAAAIELIRQRGALSDVQAGNFAAAVDRCRKEWASLPGAGYGQHENSLDRLQTAYLDAGGALA